MDKETLQKLAEAIKGLTPEQFSAITEDAIDSLFEESMPALDLSEVQTVAKAKGLPEPDGETIKKFMGGSLKYFSDVETKGSRGKKAAEDYYPTPEELTKINQLSNVDMKAEEVLVFTLHSADDAVDRSADQFTAKALKEMAALSPDKPYLMNHNWNTSSVIGKIFDASVSKGRLMQKVYVPITAKNQDMIDGMLTGIYNKVSVGFSMGAENYVCSSCSKSLYSMDCPHYPGYKDEKGNTTVGIIKGVSDYYEISNVTVPCQPAAGIRRDNQKAVDPVDTISNDKSHGDTPLSENENPTVETVTPEVTSPEVAPVVEAKTVEGVKTPAVEAKSVDLEEVKALVKELTTEVVNSLKEVIAELKATIAAKAEVVETAQEESTEEIARKLAATQVVTTDATKPAVDMSKSGWSLGVFGAINPKSNQ